MLINKFVIQFFVIRDLVLFYTSSLHCIDGTPIALGGPSILKVSV